MAACPDSCSCASRTASGACGAGSAAWHLVSSQLQTVLRELGAPAVAEAFTFGGTMSGYLESLDELKAGYGKLTDAEKHALALRPLAISAESDSAKKALAEARRRFAAGLRNGPGDAFRHCYW